MQQLLAQASALATIPSADKTVLTAAILEAVANSIAAMNAIIAESTSTADVQKVGGHGGGAGGGRRLGPGRAGWLASELLVAALRFAAATPPDPCPFFPSPLPPLPAPPWPGHGGGPDGALRQH